jgi:hypothetical protein
VREIGDLAGNGAGGAGVALMPLVTVRPADRLSGSRRIAAVPG